jgi:uncharacterized protein YbjT (DUF2867 family)
MRCEDLILVTGATGNTGSALLQQLETRGARVRAMVREQSDGGRLRGTSATVVGGNFNDPGSLEGVTRAYLVIPSSPDAEAQQVRFAELAAAAGVRTRCHRTLRRVSGCQPHIVRTTRNCALPLIIRAYASAALSSG